METENITFLEGEKLEHQLKTKWNHHQSSCEGINISCCYCLHVSQVFVRHHANWRPPSSPPSLVSDSCLFYLSVWVWVDVTAAMLACWKQKSRLCRCVSQVRWTVCWCSNLTASLAVPQIPSFSGVAFSKLFIVSWQFHLQLAELQGLYQHPPVDQRGHTYNTVNIKPKSSTPAESFLLNFFDIRLGSMCGWVRHSNTSLTSVITVTVTCVTNVLQSSWVLLISLQSADFSLCGGGKSWSGLHGHYFDFYCTKGWKHKAKVQTGLKQLRLYC